MCGICYSLNLQLVSDDTSIIYVYMLIGFKYFVLTGDTSFVYYGC